MTDHKNENLSEEDKVLYAIARKRAAFKKSLFTYFVINIFLWCIWLFSGGRQYGMSWNALPWPVWVTLGWGVGIAFQWAGAYLYPRKDTIEDEFQKLKKSEKL